MAFYSGCAPARPSRGEQQGTHDGETCHWGFPHSGLRTKDVPTLSRMGAGLWLREWLSRGLRSCGIWARPYSFPGQLVKTFPSIKMDSVTTFVLA